MKLQKMASLAGLFTIVVSFQNCSDFQAKVGSSVDAISPVSAGSVTTEVRADGSVAHTINTSVESVSPVRTLNAVDSSGKVTDEAAEALRELAIKFLGRDPSSLTRDDARNFWGSLLTSGNTMDRIAYIFQRSDETIEKVRQWRADFYGISQTTEQARLDSCGVVSFYPDGKTIQSPCTVAQWRYIIVLQTPTDQRIREIAIEALGRDGNLLTPEAAASEWKQYLFNGMSMAQLRQTFLDSSEGRSFKLLTMSWAFDMQKYLNQYADVRNFVHSGMTLEQWAKIHWFRYGSPEKRNPSAGCVLSILGPSLIPFGQSILFGAQYYGTYDPEIKAEWLGTNRNRASGQALVTIAPQLTDLTKGGVGLAEGGAFMDTPGLQTDYANNTDGSIGSYTRQLRFSRRGEVLCTTNVVSAEFLSP